MLQPTQSQAHNRAAHLSHGLAIVPQVASRPQNASLASYCSSKVKNVAHDYKVSFLKIAQSWCDLYHEIITRIYARLPNPQGVRMVCDIMFFIFIFQMLVLCVLYPIFQSLELIQQGRFFDEFMEEILSPEVVAYQQNKEDRTAKVKLLYLLFMLPQHVIINNTMKFLFWEVVRYVRSRLHKDTFTYILIENAKNSKGANRANASQATAAEPHRNDVLIDVYSGPVTPTTGGGFTEDDEKEYPIELDDLSLLGPLVMNKVMSFLDGKSLARAQNVSKNWKYTIENKRLWEGLPQSELDIQETGNDVSGSLSTKDQYVLSMVRDEHKQHAEQEQLYRAEETRNLGIATNPTTSTFKLLLIPAMFYFMFPAVASWLFQVMAVWYLMHVLGTDPRNRYKILKSIVLIIGVYIVTTSLESFLAPEIDPELEINTVDNFGLEPFQGEEVGEKEGLIENMFPNGKQQELPGSGVPGEFPGVPGEAVVPVHGEEKGNAVVPGSVVPARFPAVPGEDNGEGVDATDEDDIDVEIETDGLPEEKYSIVGDISVKESDKNLRDELKKEGDLKSEDLMNTEVGEKSVDEDEEGEQESYRAIKIPVEVLERDRKIMESPIQMRLFFQCFFAFTLFVGCVLVVSFVYIGFTRDLPVARLRRIFSICAPTLVGCLCYYLLADESSFYLWLNYHLKTEHGTHGAKLFVTYSYFMTSFLPYFAIVGFCASYRNRAVNYNRRYFLVSGSVALGLSILLEWTLRSGYIQKPAGFVLTPMLISWRVFDYFMQISLSILRDVPYITALWFIGRSVMIYERYIAKKNLNIWPLRARKTLKAISEKVTPTYVFKILFLNALVVIFCEVTFMAISLIFPCDWRILRFILLLLIFIIVWPIGSLSCWAAEQIMAMLNKTGDRRQFRSEWYRAFGLLMVVWAFACNWDFSQIDNPTLHFFGGDKWADFEFVNTVEYLLSLVWTILWFGN